MYILNCKSCIDCNLYILMKSLDNLTINLLDYMLPKVLALLNRIHTFIFRCSLRGFSATCLQQMQGSEVEGLI